MVRHISSRYISHFLDVTSSRLLVECTHVIRNYLLWNFYDTCPGTCNYWRTRIRSFREFIYPPKSSIRRENSKLVSSRITQISDGKFLSSVIHCADESINFNSANLHDRANLNKSLHDNKEERRREIAELNSAFGEREREKFSPSTLFTLLSCRGYSRWSLRRCWLCFMGKYYIDRFMAVRWVPHWHLF